MNPDPKFSRCQWPSLAVIEASYPLTRAVPQRPYRGGAKRSMNGWIRGERAVLLALDFFRIGVNLRALLA